MVKKVAGRDGLSAGRSSPRRSSHEFFQQSNETDWDFLWRLARCIDFEVVVDDDDARLPQAAHGRAAAAVDADVAATT